MWQEKTVKTEEAIEVVISYVELMLQMLVADVTDLD